MVICIVLTGVLGVLFVLSARTELPHGLKVRWGCRPFYKSGCYLAEKLKGRKKEWNQIRETEKLTSGLMILFLGLGVALFTEGAVSGSKYLIDGYKLHRPEKGEGAQTRNLQVQIGQETETEVLEISLGERQYTREEKEGFLREAMEWLDTGILGENTSPDEVRGKVDLPTVILEGRVTAEWIKDPEDLLDSEGRITENLPPEGELLQLKAVLNCHGEEGIYETALRLLPDIRSEKEQKLFDLKKQVEEAEEKTAEEEMLPLPKEFNGERLTWVEPKSSMAGMCLFVTLAGAVAAYAGKEEEFRRGKKMRSRQLIMDYPNLLFKLGMLLNAGLTIQNAFSKIAYEYRDRKKGKVRWAYEEMVAACNEMKSGVSEVQAYENFGQRCGETPYIRLGSTLAGNLQKGSQGLTDMLRKEAADAMEARRQMAKKMGEEAGTRLLMPMVLMLLVVLVILMVPAVLAF